MNSARSNLFNHARKQNTSSSCPMSCNFISPGVSADFAIAKTGADSPASADLASPALPQRPPAPISIRGANYIHRPLAHSFAAPHPVVWLFFNSALFPASRVMIMNCELIAIGEGVTYCSLWCFSWVTNTEAWQHIWLGVSDIRNTCSGRSISIFPPLTSPPASCSLGGNTFKIVQL